MQFYKFYGIIMNWSDKDKGRSATTAKTRNIYLKSIDFNRSFHKKIFFYVERIEDNILRGGILSCKYVKLHEQIKAYLSLLNISLTDIFLRAFVMSNIHFMITKMTWSTTMFAGLYVWQVFMCGVG